MSYSPNDGHVYHVAKNGSDANGGLAISSPIDLSAEAKLTIAATVATASAGDTIVIWPGTYGENLDLSSDDGISLIGAVGQRSAKIIKSHNGNLIVLGDKCRLENLHIENSYGDGSKALYNVTAADGGYFIKNCYIYGYEGALHLEGLSTDTSFIIDSTMVGSEYGVRTNNKSLSIRNSPILIDGQHAACQSIALNVTAGKTTVSGGYILSYAVAAAVENYAKAVSVGSSSTYAYVNIDNCPILTNIENSDWGDLVYIGGGQVQISNSLMTIVAVGTDSIIWANTGPPVTVTGDFVNHNGKIYDCISDVGAPSAAKEPGVGVDWETYFTLAVFTNYPLRVKDNRGQLRLTNCLFNQGYIGAGVTYNVNSDGRVDVASVAGTAQTANDNGADINEILTDTGATLDGKINTINTATAAVDTLSKASGDGDLAAILGDTNAIQGKLPTNKFMGSSDGADDDGTLNTISTAAVAVDTLSKASGDGDLAAMKTKLDTMSSGGGVPSLGD